MRSVVPSGPPEVITKAGAKDCNENTVMTTTTNIVVRPSSGMTISAAAGGRRRHRSSPHPWTSGGIDCRPDRNSTAATPICCPDDHGNDRGQCLGLVGQERQRRGAEQLDAGIDQAVGRIEQERPHGGDRRDRGDDRQKRHGPHQTAARQPGVEEQRNEQRDRGTTKATAKTARQRRDGEGLDDIGVADEIDVVLHPGKGPVGRIEQREIVEAVPRHDDQRHILERDQ